MKNIKTFTPIVAILILLSSTMLSACTTNAGSNSSHAYVLAPLEEMHISVQSAPPQVAEAYQFAVANHEILKRFPCYCGCGGMGHTSNYSCYVSENEQTGELGFDGHALGCSICVDITRDVMRMLDQGKDLTSISSYIDTTYSAFGPSNMP